MCCEMTVTKTRRFVVDSRSRVPGEEPDQYTVRLTYPLTGVSGISLVGSNVPFSSRTIGRGNDTIHVVYLDGATKSFVEAIMAHTDAADDAALETAVRDAMPADIAVARDDAGRFTFTRAVGPFALYGTGAVARLIGMNNHVPSALDGIRSRDAWGGIASEFDGAAHVAVAAYTPDRTQETYLLLTTSVGGSVESSEQAADGAMAVIGPGVVDVAHPVAAKPRTSEIHRMDIKITRPTGEPYDFAGRNHRLDFDIV